MVARARASILDSPRRALEMRALWRLATWGGAASLALVLAVVASYSDTGSRRLLVAMHSAPAPAPRATEADAETRRLTEAVRTLAADRERLMARVGTLERSLEEITGSISRPSGKSDAAGPTAAPAPTPTAPAIVPVAAPEAVLPKAPEAATEARVAAATAPAVAPAAAPSPERVAAAPIPTTEEIPEPPRPELGVDIGGAVNFEGLRVLWSSTKGGNAALFEGMHPVVAVRENSRSKSPELRLIVGPIASVETASRLCAALSAARRYCQPVAFEGQRLAEAETAPERKPAAAPRSTPRPAPPAQSKLPRLFQ
jgi:hypothetical protein